MMSLCRLMILRAARRSRNHRAKSRRSVLESRRRDNARGSVCMAKTSAGEHATRAYVCSVAFPTKILIAHHCGGRGNVGHDDEYGGRFVHGADWTNIDEDASMECFGTQ